MCNLESSVMKRVVRHAIIRQLSKTNGSSESRGESKEAGRRGELEQHSPSLSLPTSASLPHGELASLLFLMCPVGTVATGTTPDLGA